MKKKILLIFILAIFGFAKANAFTVAQINGTVTNSQSGLPIASHLVTITDSISFTQSYFTNSNGFFNDSIYNNSSNPVKYYIITYDCNNVMHYDTVTNSGYVYHISNFSICSALVQDIGVISISNPQDTSYLAGYNCYPSIKVKNYSTAQVYSVKIGYSINGQTPVIQTISVYQFMPNDTITCNIGYPFILPNSNFTFCGFVLNADGNTSNDTICRTIINSLPSTDAGVIDVLYPLNSVNVGDSIAPVIKFKNYGTNTLTNVQLGYRSNDWGNFTLETWNGSLPHDSTAVFTFSQKFQVSTSFNLHFEAYTFLTGDQNWLNDSSLKIIPAIPSLDAGIISINFPVNSITVGDSIAPVFQIKNFGTNTLYNIPMRYSINGQLIATENWTGNLPQNSTATYTFLHKFVASNTNNLYLYAKLHLVGDYYQSNDSIYKIINVNPAQIDVGVVEIISPADVTCSGMQTYPKVVIKNFGITPLTSIPLSCQRGSSTIVTGNWTRLVPLNYGDTVHFTFATFFNVPIGTSYAFTAYTTLTNDANPINNKVSKSVLIGSPPPTSFNIIGDDTVIIGQSNVAYHADYFAYNSDQYIWTLPPGAVIDTVYNNYIVINYGNNAQSGNITCKIMNACGISQTVVLPISVFATPPPPIIYQSGSTLYSGYSTGNQWYFNNVAISGATQPTYIPANTGYYYCMVTINGSVSYASNSIYVALTGIDDAFIKSHFSVYPNPFTDKTNFNYSLNRSALVNLKISDMEGRLIRTLVNEEQSIGEFSYQLNANNLSKGIYFYQFTTGNTSLNGKLIIK